MNHTQWWQKPALRTDEEDDLHRAVTWLELFFDLVFVVVIASLAHGFAADLSVHGLVSYLWMFLAVWWVWNAMTYYVERFESDGLENRFFLFLTMIPVAGLAIHAHHGLGDNYIGFALSYLLARSINMGMWIRAGIHVPEFRPVSNRFMSGFLVAAIIIIVSFFVDKSLIPYFWGIALTVDILTPSFTVKQQQHLPKISSSKLPERMGLLTIIVLGETVAGVIKGMSENHHLAGIDFLNGILGLWLGFSLWWIYFDFIARRPPHYHVGIAMAWTYLHLFLNICITSTGIGILAVFNEITNSTGDTVPQLLLIMSLGLSLIFIGLLEATLQDRKGDPHPFFSKFLKISIGFILIVGAFYLPVLNVTLLMCLLALVLLPHKIYGSLIWFGRYQQQS